MATTRERPNPYQQDANQFAAWGFDAVKVDFCGAGQQWLDQPPHDPRTLYGLFSQALAATGRSMVLNVCNFWTPGKINGIAPAYADSSWDTFSWAPAIAQSWRTDTDIGFAGNVAFKNVLRNLDQDATHPEAAGPGHWNDPDYLAPELGMSSTEAQTQFSMWAIAAAPLILGSDPRALSSQTISMLQNPNVIAVDQDSLGAQGTAVQQTGAEQAWSKPLANGDRAVALLNRGTTPLQISTTASAVGLPHAGTYSFQDLWGPTTTTTDDLGNISRTVPAHGVALYRVSASGSAPSDPGTAVLTTATAGSGLGTVDDHSAIPSCLGTCAHRYSSGTSITLSAVPSAGSRFSGWTGGGCSGTATCTIALGADTEVTATFTALQTLSVALAGDGAGTVSDNADQLDCPAMCSASYDQGTSVTLTARPNPGSAFVGWSGGGCSGTDACTVTLGAGEMITAKFVRSHVLSVSVIGAGRGTVSGPGISCPGTCSASYPEGTPVTLVATAAGHSVFGAWLSGGCPPAGSSCTLGLSADTTLSVAFDRSRAGTAYVVNGGNDSVTPINLATNTAEPAITGFHRPRDIATSPDGATAYVVNAGTETVTPINLATNAIEPAITGFRRPGPIAVTGDGRTAYILEDGRRLVAADLSTHQIRSALRFAKGSGIGEFASSIALAPHGHLAYLGTFSRRSGSVAAVDLLTGRLKAVIHGFAHPAAIAIAPNGATAYVLDSARGDVVPISLASDRRVREPQLTVRGAIPGAAGFVIAPGGSTAYVTGTAGLYSLSLVNRSVGRLSSAGFTGGGGVAIDPGGTALYATGDGTVVPFDLATRSSRPAVIGLSSPRAIAVALPPPRDYSVRITRPFRASATWVSGELTCTSTAFACVTVASLITRTGSLGMAEVRILPGQTVGVTIRLVRSARQSVARVGRLAAVLVLAIRRDGHQDTLMTSMIMLRRR